MKLLFSLLLAGWVGQCTGSPQAMDPYVVPTFTADELAYGHPDGRLMDVLTSTGLLAIRLPPNPEILDTIHNNNNHNRDFHLLNGLCDCHDNLGTNSIEGGDEFLMKDGLTKRKTIATATMGTDHPLSLPKDDIIRQCTAQTYDDLEIARDYVSRAASDLFIPALDRLIATHQSTQQLRQVLLRTKNGEDYTNVASIVNDAVNLEHFHLYSKSNHFGNNQEEEVEEEEDPTATSINMNPTLDWHTDAGLFLAFLPGKSCSTNTYPNPSYQNHDDNVHSMDDSFSIKHPDTNQQLQVIFPSSEENGEIIVAIMLGIGAEHWLPQNPYGLKLRATRHAVHMNNGDTRAWYGMMHLVPKDAIIHHEPREITFAEFKTLSSHTHGRHFGNNSDELSDPNNDQQVVIGCGTEEMTTVSSNLVNNTLGMNLVTHRRRRLQHVGGPEDCNQSDNFFCWLSCLDVPDDGVSVEDHLKNGESLYCLDPSILVTELNLEDAVAACSDSSTGLAGGVMDAACGNYWYHRDPNVPNHIDHLLDDLDNIEDQYVDKYCYGATAMYMQGFEWEGTTCVVYLFSSWVITTRLALFLACLGTVLFGIITEYTIRQRRMILSKTNTCMTRKYHKVVLSVGLYGMQLTMGYLLMLVVMSYSGPLVLSVIVGLMLGHYIWNQCDIIDSKVETIEGTTPCCQNTLFDINEEEIMKDEEIKKEQKLKEDDYITTKSLEQCPC